MSITDELRDQISNAVAEEQGAAPQVMEAVAEEPQAEPQAEEPQAEPQEAQEASEGKPYLSLEEFTAQGRDPEFYMGEKAYAQQQKLLAEKKAETAKAKDRDSEMVNMASQIDEISKNLKAESDAKVEAMRQELETAKEKARSELDMDAFEDASKKLSNMEPQAPQEPLPIQAARQADQRLNPAAPGYDKTYERMVQGLVNGSIGEAYSTLGRQLTDQELAQHMNEAMQQADSMTQSSPKKRPAPAPSAPTPKAVVPQIDSQSLATIQRWENSGDEVKMKAAKQMRKNLTKKAG